MSEAVRENGPQTESSTDSHPFFSSSLYRQYNAFIDETVLSHQQHWKDYKRFTPEESQMLARTIQTLCSVASSFNVLRDTPSKLLRPHSKGFQSLIDNMLVFPGICRQPDVFTSTVGYENRRGARLAMDHPEPRTPLIPGIGSHEIDAPLVFTLVLLNDKSQQFHEIATVSAWPDVRSKTLYIDQIQGPWEDENGNMIPLERTARDCFAQAPAPALAAMALLAEQAGFMRVGIRDAGTNWHDKIRKRAGDSNNPYARAVEDYQHYFFADTPYKEGSYTIIPLPKKTGDLISPIAKR